MLVLPVLMVLLGLPAVSWGWGAEGHEIVGTVAEHLISSKTRVHILQILGDESLKDASTWADEVKHHTSPTGLKPPLNTDSDSIAFVNAAQKGQPNADNDRWHFANLPLGATDYHSIFTTYKDLPSPDDPFASERDIVHVINVCIQRLKGQPVTGFTLSQKNALRLLVHLVGDLQQPLHIGSGYIAASPSTSADLLVRDPKTIADGHLKGDRGGNELFYHDQPAEELHAHWDTDLVKYAMKMAPAGVRHNVDDYASYLATLPTQITWNGTGNVTSWAEQWANETLVLARDAYQDVTPTSTKSHPYTSHFNHKSQTEQGYPVQLGSHYDDKDAPQVKTELAKAGYRLAKILDAIWQH